MSKIAEFSDIYEDDHYYPEEYYYNEETITDIWNNCVVLSVLGVVPTLINIVGLNFGFGCLLSTGLLSEKLFHLISGSIGIYLLNTLESSLGKVVLFGCFTSSYILVLVSCLVKKYLHISNSNFVKFVTVPLLILCEYYLIGPEVWLEIRGVVMVLVMKLISLADDIEEANSPPNILQYFGYTLCGANVMFGPWISLSDYLNLYNKPVKKNIYWIPRIFQILLTSLFFLSISNCWANYFVPDDANRWLVAYKEAFSFRTSHYFICYLSEVGMVAAGFTNSSKKFLQWRYTITEPLEIEFPSSLAMVVRKWNQPMHDFLKKYVYRSWLNYGQFPAIFATFLMSSFLHGFELKVSAVLVSLGVFSYLQVAPRDKIAEIFDCCVRVRPCKDCTHRYKRDDIRVKITLFIYSFSTVFHLVYLGVLMDPSTDKIGIYGKWQNLYFLSHIVMFFNVLIMC